MNLTEAGLAPLIDRAILAAHQQERLRHLGIDLGIIGQAVDAAPDSLRSMVA